MGSGLTFFTFGYVSVSRVKLENRIPSLKRKDFLHLPSPKQGEGRVRGEKHEIAATSFKKFRDDTHKGDSSQYSPVSEAN